MSEQTNFISRRTAVEWGINAVLFIAAFTVTTVVVICACKVNERVNVMQEQIHTLEQNLAKERELNALQTKAQEGLEVNFHTLAGSTDKRFDESREWDMKLIKLQYNLLTTVGKLHNIKDIPSFEELGTLTEEREYDK